MASSTGIKLEQDVKLEDVNIENMKFEEVKAEDVKLEQGVKLEDEEVKPIPPPMTPKLQRSGVKIYLRRDEDGEMRFGPIPAARRPAPTTPIPEQRSGIKLHLRRGNDHEWRFVKPRAPQPRSGIKLHFRRDHNGELRFVPAPQRLVRCCQYGQAFGHPASHRYSLRSRAVKAARRT